MLYAFIGSLLAGSLGTVIALWLKARTEKKLVGVQAELKAALERELGWKESCDTLKNEYNNLVDHANAEIAKLNDEKKELLNALEKSGKPGVFADLLRAKAPSP